MPARRPPHKPAALDAAGRGRADRARADSELADSVRVDSELAGRELAGRERADPEERLEMCRLISRAEPGVEACGIELGREGPSYTVDTLRALSADDPSTPLTFILGADVARTLPAWREPRELLALAELAVALRPGTAAREVRAALAPLFASTPPRAGAGAGARAGADAHARGAPARGGDAPEARVRFLSMPPLEVSSSLVRERVRRGEPVDGLTGPDVARYIAAHGLYRAQPAPVAGVSAQ